MGNYSNLENYTGSDIFGHIDRLIGYGIQCRHITEFGVRDGESTVAWIKSTPEKLVCVDVSKPSCLIKIQNECRNMGILFEFYQKNTKDIDIDPTDLLFIDTFHTETLLGIELNRHSDKVSKFIILHDTETFGKVGQDGAIGGLKMAMCEFLLDHPEWKIIEHFKDWNGLTVLNRCLAVDL